MPNWVYNHLTIEGSEEEIAKVKAQLGKPIQKRYAEDKEVTNYSNPIISFWNIIAPPDDKLDEYFGTHGYANGEKQGQTEYNWYNFNNTKWGTKWDIAVRDSEEYSDTSLEEEHATVLRYRFNTAWSPPLPAIEELSLQYPKLEITLEYEEEQGWGGEILWTEEGSSIVREYDIPNSHKDYADRDEVDNCVCQREEDEDEWYSDCPDKTVVIELFLDNEMKVLK
jgi:hypothetical protein